MQGLPKIFQAKVAGKISIKGRLSGLHNSIRVRGVALKISGRIRQKYFMLDLLKNFLIMEAVA